ncbi:hypothetical protein TNCV_4143581 [Trichonephila clavipes]|nr:hypothetical protein TNCV_4143581 [Trichonephila clavipes]
MGTLPSSRRGKCVTLFGGVRGTPRNSSSCKQQQGRYTNYCCNPYGKAAPHQYKWQDCKEISLLSKYGCDSIFKSKECVHIYNEKTPCSKIVSIFSIQQTRCRKPQYDRDRSAKFFNDRNHHGTNW